MLRTLRAIATSAQHAGIPLSVCGEMAGEPIHVPVFLGLGINQLSMNASAIPRIKRLVRELNHGDCVALMTDLLACDTHVTASELVRSFLTAKASVGSAKESEDAGRADAS